MKLLVLRLSSLGDVAMTVPVIHSLARQHPHLDVTVLSRPFVAPLFARMPANVRFLGIDFKEYKGIAGLYRLSRRLKGFDAVADLHDVLRTKVLRTLLAKKRTAHIDKGRKEKRALVGHKAPLYPPKGGTSSSQSSQVASSQVGNYSTDYLTSNYLTTLPSTFERYADVFRRLGLTVEVDFRSVYGEGRGDAALFSRVTGEPDGRHWIGIAPFAAHRGKTLPEETLAQLTGLAAQHKDWRVFLFGGKADAENLSRYEGEAESLAGKLTLSEELALMSHLDVMVSMDSANMHLASLTATPVVSVWGATHPYAGFMGWRQTVAVQADLPCRPCSIFGNKPCQRGDYACLTQITAQQIIHEIERIICNS